EWNDLLWLLFLVSIIFQALLWGVYYVVWRQSDTRYVADQAPLSVIICARNEAVNLRRHLPAVLQQEYPGFELIVVDDASTDETAAVLAAFQREFPDRLCALRIDHKTHPGKKQSLALGIEAASNEILVFTDADCRPSTNRWLRRLAAPFAVASTEIVLGYGPMMPAAGLLNAWARFETAMIALQYFTWAKAGRPYMGVGRNLAWRRPLFARAGGFHTQFDLASGDDDLLVNALANAQNTAICLHPDAWVWSAAPQTLRAWFRQKRRHLTAGRRYRPLDQLLLAATGLSHAGVYACGCTLLLQGFWAWPLSVLAVRAIALRAFFTPHFRRLGVEAIYRCQPLPDIGWAVYQGLLTPVLLLLGKWSKQRW
ncbi:MAG: glycosyltransferase, partial [Saprospiraceae bacterium]